MDKGLWVSFVNTQYLEGGNPVDSIASDSDLVNWARRRTIIDEDIRAETLQEGEDVLGRARMMRTHLRAMAASLSSDEEVGSDVQRALNDVLSASNIHHLFDRDGDETTERIAIEGPGALPILTLVALSAGRFLAGDDTDRVKQCASSECILYFVDSSRNRSRRWCSMETCGNREKVRAHYQRKATHSGR